MSERKGEDREESVRNLIAEGVSLLQAGDLRGAEDKLTSAQALQPESPNLLKAFASLWWRLGEYRRAAEVCQALLAGEPANGHLLNSLAACHLAMGEPAEAAAFLERATSTGPPNPAFLHNLGIAYHQLGRLKESEVAFRRAVALDPEDIPSLIRLAQVLLLLGDRGSSEQFRRVYEVAPTSPDGQAAMAQALLNERGDLEEARHHILGALKVRPQDAPNQTLHGLILQRLGEFDAAAAAFELAHGVDPDFAPPYWHEVQTRRATRAERSHVNTMIRMAEGTQHTIDERRSLHFAIGKVLDDLGEYPTAMHHFRSGNQLSQELRTDRFDPKRFEAEIDEILAAFKRDGSSKPIPAGSESDQPMLIVGMPRSGTTLLEQILSCHPGVAAGSELGFWARNAHAGFNRDGSKLDAEGARRLASEYLRLLDRVGGKADRVTDKMPDNYRWVGLVHALFPNARILFCIRNPVDTCLSCFTTLLAEPPTYMHDPAHLVLVYKQHLRLLEHWSKLLPNDRFRTVEYESLVLDRESTTRQVVEFCGLSWDDACLRPETNPRPVTTASLWQARKAVYQSSLDRRGNYRDCLGEFEALL